MTPISSGLADWTDAQSSKFDAYLLAALRTGFHDYATGGSGAATIAVGLTLRAGPGHSVEAITAFMLACFANGEGRLTTAHLQDLKEGGWAFLTADVTGAQLRRLVDVEFVVEVQLCADLAPNRSVPRLVSDPHAKSAPASPIKSGKTRVLGVIDHGCPFAHQAFVEGGQTRFLAIWDQDEVPDFPAVSGSTPLGFGYGRQVGSHALNTWIQDATDAGGTDETRCYRIAEYRAMQSSYTHGSLVLGLLSDRWRPPGLGEGKRSEMDGMAAIADLVFVQLPRSIPLAPSRGSIERCTLDGVRYILECSPDNSEVTVVVDYGTDMGPHDGSSWFERALDALIHRARIQRGITVNVVYPSGNSSELKRHAIVFWKAGAAASTAALGWSIPRSNDGPSTIELWTYAAHANFHVTVSRPGGQNVVLSLAALSDTVTSWPASGPPAIVAVCRKIGGQIQILIQAAPTNVSSASLAIAPAGVWTLRFVPEQNLPLGPVFVYACWGGRNPGFGQRLWPSKFVVAGDQADVVRITGDGSIFGSGCGDKTLMAGSSEMWGRRRRAEFSSGGAARGGKRRDMVKGADWVVGTEESPCLPGLLCLGTRSGNRVRARGTSFAAPQVARVIVVSGSVPQGRPHLPGPTPGTVNRKKPRIEYGEPRL